MSNLPFFAIGNGELEGRPHAVAGDVVACHRCKAGHALTSPEAYRVLDDGRRVPVPSSLLTYACPEGSSYLGAVGGRLLPGVELIAEVLS